jgi:hypothetical protein
MTKRETPLTTEERRERDRAYQHKSRHKNNNAYARANRRLLQRCGEYVRENHKALYTRWQREELAVEEERRRAGLAKKYAPILAEHGPFVFSREDCPHSEGTFAIGVAVACSLCGTIQGTVGVETDEDMDALNDIIRGVSPSLAGKRAKRQAS